MIGKRSNPPEMSCILGRLCGFADYDIQLFHRVQTMSKFFSLKTRRLLSESLSNQLIDLDIRE
jgi:hypothetical protein